MARQNRSVAFWLEQIVSMSERLERHLRDMDAEEFLVDQKTIDAASWCISCIGEACGKILEIDPEFEHKAGVLRLAGAYAARNRYVHGYFDLDLDLIWSTASRSVPELAAATRRILDEQA